MQRLGQLMNLDAFQKCHLLTEKDFSLDTVIQGITIIEAPDIASWIDPGTMLLTSFYGVHDSLDKQKALIYDLAQAQAGALVIKVDRYVQQVDAQVIDYANQMKLPVLELEGDVPYVELMVAVMGALFHEQVYRLNYFKLSHEKFMDICLAQKGVGDVVLTLSELLGKDVLLVDERGHELEASFNEPRDVKDATHLRDVKIASVTKAQLLVFDLPEPSELDKIALDNALVSLILIMSRQQAIKEAEFHSKGEFMNDLLYGRLASMDELREKSKFYRWKLELPTVVLGFTLLDETDDKKQEDAVQDFLFYLRAQGLLEIHTKKSKRSLFFLQEKRQDQDLMRKIKDAVQDYLSSPSSRQMDAAFGIGRIAQNSKEIRRSFKEAMDSLDLIEKELVDKKLVVYDELGIYKLLGRYDKRGELEDYIPEAILILHAHDEATGENLTETLECYLKNNMNAVRASEMLFLHYKTVHYRLGKMKQIAHIDFDNREQILEIEVGLKILRMMEPK